MDFRETLRQLQANLNILQERAAKFGNNAPLELVNQIVDHKTAIGLTEQALAGELDEAEWREALRPLLVVGPDLMLRKLDDLLEWLDAQMAGLGRRVEPSLEEALERLAALPLDAVPEVGVLPAGSRMVLSRNPQFVGRVADLKALAKALKGGETAVIGQIAAATGLGGIGKTQLASEFMHRYGSYFLGGVFWLSMAEPESVAAEVALCGGPNGLGLYTEAGGLSLDEQVGMVRAAWGSGMPRLLVFDNCEDEQVLAAWRPVSGGCRVLVTSRRGSWDRSLGVAVLALGVLSRGESVELLGKFREDLLTAGGPPLVPAKGGEELGVADEGEVGGPPLVARGGEVGVESGEAVGGPPLVPPKGGEAVGAAEEGDGQEDVDYGILGEIARELGDLPLALHLAGSFLTAFRAARFGQPEVYLKQLRGMMLGHPSLVGEGAAVSPTGHERHVARTFALSYERLDAAEPVDAMAVALLGRAAYFAPGEPIPRDLLLATLKSSKNVPSDKSGFGGWLKKLKTFIRPTLEGDNEFEAELRAEKALRRLVTLGLLETEADGAAVLHRLLAVFVLNEMGDEAGQAAVEETVLVEAERLNIAGIPGPMLAWQPHLRVVTDIAQERDDEGAAELCSEFGYHLRMIGDYAGARTYFERALAISEKVLGSDHPDTAGNFNNLGVILQALGDYTGARSYLEQALAIWEQVLGSEHPDTARSLNNLGFLLNTIGDYAGARSYYERALAIREQVLGPTHPDTALSLNNLGFLLQTMGDYEEARPYYEQALAIREQVLGPKHPDTATSLNNLGGLLKSIGDTEEARTYFKRALVIWERTLGPEHPNTRTVRRNLARLD
jgi:tetratricopeptide (TPR) repeat protein